jgi:putative transposase
MNTYKRHRFPPEIISYAVWLCFRFNLSHRLNVGPLVQDLLAQLGINVIYESLRFWCLKFGPKYAKRLRRKHSGFGDIFFVDEVFIKVGGKQYYLWRAVDQGGEVLDMLLQTRQTPQRHCVFSK